MRLRSSGYDSLPAMIKGWKEYLCHLRLQPGPGVRRQAYCCACLSPAGDRAVAYRRHSVLLVRRFMQVNVATVAGVTCQHDPTARRHTPCSTDFCGGIAVYAVGTPRFPCCATRGITWRGTYYPIALLKSGDAIDPARLCLNLLQILPPFQGEGWGGDGAIDAA